MDANVKFERVIGYKGAVLGVSIPPELLSYLEAKDGDVMEICADSGKRGRFISMWVKGK